MLATEDSPIYTLREVCDLLERHQRDVRTLILIRGIPTVKIGNAFAINEAGLKALKVAFAELDQTATARGMKVAAAV